MKLSKKLLQMITLNRYFVKTLSNDLKERFTCIYAHNKAEAREWALKMNDVIDVLEVTFDEAVEYNEEEY